MVGSSLDFVSGAGKNNQYDANKSSFSGTSQNALNISSSLRTVFVLAVMLLSVNAVAESEPDVAPPLLISEYKNTITLNSGAYNLSRRSQEWKVLGPLTCGFFCWLTGPSYSSSPLANEFDTSSRNIYGLDYERHIKHGFSYGLSYFQIQNSFVIPSLTPSNGELKAKYYFANVNKYFGDADGLRPFIGIGVGQVRSKLSGSINRSADGSAAQALLGLRYQTGRISFLAEYRLVRTSMSAGIGGADGTGSIYGSMDLSGRGNFVGMGVHF